MTNSQAANHKGWLAGCSTRTLGFLEAIINNRSKISCSLTKSQPFLCTPACVYESHALAVYPQPAFTVPAVRSGFGIWSVVELFYKNILRVKAVGCFCRGAPLLIFDRILNVTLSEEKVSTIGATQGNQESLLRPNSPDSPQTQIQEDEILD